MARGLGSRIRGVLGTVARRAGREVLSPLDRVGQLVDPTLKLLRADSATARTWARSALAVQEALGPEAARGYGDLLLEAVAVDPAVARELASRLPDQLARVEAGERERYLQAVRWSLRERPQAVMAVAENLPPLLPSLDDPALRRFLVQGLALLQDNPEKAASFLRVESDAGREALGNLRRGVALQEVSRTLALYAAAHCGEDVRLVPALEGQGTRAFADGHHLHLPPWVDRFGDERDFLVYRVETALCAGYLEFGTFDLDLGTLPGDWPPRRSGETDLLRLFRGLGRHTLARDLFQVLEDVRVEARVRAAYPGVARDLERLRGAPERTVDPPGLAGLSAVDQVVALLARAGEGERPGDAEARAVAPEAWAVFTRLHERLPGLRTPEASVRETATILIEAWPDVTGLLARAESDGPPRAGRTGARSGPRAAEERERRITRSRARDRRSGSDDPEGPPPRGRLRPELRGAEEQALDEEILALRDARAAAGTGGRLAEVRREVKRRRRASYEEMDAWLEAMEGPAGGRVDPSAPRPDTPRPLAPALREGVDPADLEDPAAFVYPEWDNVIGDYKPRWVLLREYPLRPGSRAFVDEVTARHRSLILSLRRQFEALRPEETRVARGLPHGDELDVDRVVEAFTVRRAGGTPSERLYLRHERNVRDVAVAFLLDMSSSTNEVVSGGSKRIIEVEKEALVLIAEAVDAIGDAFAIYGFSGYGPDQVAFYVAKEFDAPYGPEVRERIGAMSWKMENRDGAAIRHATRKLLRRPARVRLLVLLSDGKPLDCGCDRYYDTHAQEDTRMALREARKAGIHPFCITVDPHSRDYLRRMYGDAAYTIIDRVETLPRRIPAIYRRLTR